MNSTDKKMLEMGFDHPCKDTCSGWQQGYDRGHLTARSQMHGCPSCGEQFAYGDSIVTYQEQVLMDKAIVGDALEKERAKSARLLEAIKWCLDQDWSYGRCGPVGVNMALAEALLSVGEGIE